jgi:acetoin utilization deacetylase AcuC-like enzyme
MLIYDDLVFDGHEPGPGHPERPERLAAARRALEGIATEVRLSRPATDNELTSVHSAKHVEAVLQLDGRSVTLEADTILSAGSVTAAIHAAGASIDAAAALCDGRNSFVLCRPPGHHAESDRAMGFCVFNNAALAAQRLRRPPGGARNRVVVFDPDVHHGNGTQQIFYEQADVLVVSLHRFPFYPYSGAPHEIGKGVGRGSTLNVPLPQGAGDAEYKAVMRTLALPAIERFAPDAIVISAGFDALAGDPLGQMELTPDGMAALWGALVGRWPVMAVLEGGYDLFSLEAGVRATAAVLAGGSAPSLDGPAPSRAVQELIDLYKHPLLSPSWKGWAPGERA